MTHSKAQWLGVGIIAVAIVVVAFCLRQAETKVLASATTNQPLIIDDAQGLHSELWYLPNDELLGFVEISAGSFLMGSDPAVDRSAYENERWSQTQKQGRVALPTFYMARFEVTAAQFKAFVNDTNRSVRGELLPKNALSPIVNITWADAITYCQWLTQKLKDNAQTPASIKNLLEQGWTINLPTEAQWEKAARGENGNIFPWGNNPSNQFANFGGKGIKPVGSLPCEQCAYGLADMSGNVWELTRSSYLPYPYRENAEPDLNTDALFVMRGGSFSDQLNNVRAAIRGGIDPGVRNPGIGFRITLTRE